MTRPPVHKVTEAEFQEQVVELLDLHGWEHRHVSATAPTRAVRVVEGDVGRLASDGWRPDFDARDLPDLIAWRPDGAIAAFELKVKPRKLTPGQRALLLAWRAAGVPCWALYPDDLEDVPGLLRIASNWCRSRGPFIAIPAKHA